MENENLLVKIERADAELKLLRELMAQKDERITHIAEEVGETRSMLMRKEQEFKELAIQLDKTQAMVQALDPSEILKSMAKKDQKITEGEVRLEKLESTAKDLRKALEELKQIFGKIEGFESIVTVHKEVDENLSKVKSRADDVMRIAEKVENTFFELDKRLRELDKTVARVSKIEDLHKDVVRIVDGISVRMDNAPNREEIQTLRKSVTGEVEAMKNAFNAQKTGMESDLQETKKAARSFAQETAILQSRLKDIEGTILESSKSINGLGLQIKEFNKDIENITEKFIELQSEMRNAMTAQAKSVGVAEERLSTLTKAFDDSKKRSLDMASVISNLNLSSSKLMGEVDVLKKDFEAMRTDMSMFDGKMTYLNTSIETLSSRMNAIKENIDKDMKDAYIERRRFMDSISATISNSIKANEETIQRITKFNQDIKSVAEAMEKFAESISGMEGKTLEKEEAEGIKSSISNLVKNIGKMEDAKGKN